LQTTSGAILGTPAYSSPEQVDSRPLDKRSDLYSLGVVVYELCAGQVPFTADTVPSLYYKIAHETPPEPSRLNARVASPIETVLLKALAKDREQRYQSGQEFSAAFTAAVEQVTGEHLSSLYREAQTLHQQGDLDGAEDRLRQVLAIKPAHAGAQVLLTSIRQQREAQQRYQHLSDQVKHMQTEAADLRQANPLLNDPDRIFDLFPSAAAKTATEPGPTQSPAFTRRTRAIGIAATAIVIAALGLVLIGLQNSQISIAAAADFRTEWNPSVAAIANQLGLGNFLIGLGLGVMAATVAWQVVFYFTTKKKV
jgi:serine/threonine protein kinase